MKAIVQSEYGSADVLSLQELDKPAIADNEVLVRVHGASVHAGDWHLMRGNPFLIRLMTGGVLKPKVTTIGTDVSGRVEAVGKDVQQFRLGDEVFGDLSECGFGAFSEYISVPENALVHKPANLSFEESATVPVSGLAALQALRDCGEVQSGQRVLINGASGGVGSFAIQLAKGFGAEVTAVCSKSKIEMVKSLGADYVVDYTQSDPTKPTQPYDVIIDAAAFRPFS
ncbi:MAG: NAD(P)-dependent alcohol dehydrogenase, partial [Cyanobacteria bacterium J06643_4]